MKRRLIFNAVFAMLLFVACESADQLNSEGRSPRPAGSDPLRDPDFFPAPARDIPRPPRELGVFHLGGNGTTWFASPDPKNVSKRFARELFISYRSAMGSQGWRLADQEIAKDGAWTAAWTKRDRIARLTFGPELRGDRVSLIVEMCPPLRVGYCNPGTLHPMSES